MPDSPSTITSLTSAAVAPTRAIRCALSASTSARMYSAPVLVFPQPLPVSMSQMRHRSAEGSCSTRAQKPQLYQRADLSGAVSRFSLVSISLGSRPRNELALKVGEADLDCVSILAG